MKRHELKILPEYYNAVREGRKRFELRKDDRGFDVGDRLHLRKWDPAGGYTGEVILTDITYILRGVPGYGLAEDYCVMSLGKVIEAYERPGSEMEGTIR